VNAAPAGRTGAIGALSAYHPNRPAARVDLSDNTSLWGPPPSARAALAALPDERLSRYPTPDAELLVAELARHHGVDPSCVAVGCGSDDVLASAFRACLDANDMLCTAVPTFSVIPSFATVNELALAEVPVAADATVRAADLLASGADGYYVCSPNNPTGICMDLDELDALADATRGIVVVDEAYVDFAERSALEHLDRHDNLVVVRTLSKAYGLAGLRVGYAIGPADAIARIVVARGPYKVGTLAEAVAVAVVRHDGAWVRDRVGDVRALRATFTERLRARGFRVLDSEANFVAIQVDDAHETFARMLDAGVLVRAYASLPVLGDLIRVTIGPAAMLDEALEALEAAR